MKYSDTTDKVDKICENFQIGLKFYDLVQKFIVLEENLIDIVKFEAMNWLEFSIKYLTEQKRSPKSFSFAHVISRNFKI